MKGRKTCPVSKAALRAAQLLRLAFPLGNQAVCCTRDFLSQPQWLSGSLLVQAACLAPCPASRPTPAPVTWSFSIPKFEYLSPLAPSGPLTRALGPVYPLNCPNCCPGIVCRHKDKASKLLRTPNQRLERECILLTSNCPI